MIKNNIILIGFMGCGKTTLGNQIANKYKLDFVDTDSLIEENSNLKISEIFSRYGEEYFRKLETSTLENLVDNTKNIVISTGGGMVMREENVKLLKKIGKIIYLKTSKEELISRLYNDDNRPLLKDKNLNQVIDDLLLVREPVYKASADYIIQTDGKTIEILLNEIDDEVIERNVY